MEHIEQNQVIPESSTYLRDEIDVIKSLLSYGLNVPFDEIKISFPTLNNFYFINNVYKSSWAIYLHKDKLPKLLYTGNFLIQGGQYGKRSLRSPFGVNALSSLTSIANTFSYEASFFKQNWTMDLNLSDDNSEKLILTVKEYQSFLKILNKLRALWALHLSEEANIDFVITEFSEPTDALFFMNLEDFDSLATKVKTYFKPISHKSLELFQKLSLNTEFEGKFFNLQPGTWLRDDVLIEMEKFSSIKNAKNFALTEEEKQILNQDLNESPYNNPFRVQALKPSF